MRRSARSCVAGGPAGICLLVALLLACSTTKVIAPAVELAQHVAEPYHLVFRAEGVTAGVASIRGVGFSAAHPPGGTAAGMVDVQLVKMSGRDALTLYHGTVDMVYCGGLEIVVENGTISLDQVPAAEAARIWPALSCTSESSALHAQGGRRTLYQEPLPAPPRPSDN